MRARETKCSGTQVGHDWTCAGNLQSIFLSFLFSDTLLRMWLPFDNVYFCISYVQK